MVEPTTKRRAMPSQCCAHRGTGVGAAAPTTASSSSSSGCVASNVSSSSHMIRRHAQRGGVVECGNPTYLSFHSLVSSHRGYLVRFDTTPNDECMKFFVDEESGNTEGFLREYLAERRAQLQQQDQSASSSPSTGVAAAMTMSFDSTNSFQSPLADAIITNLPMVEEVTIGAHFITVRRMIDEEYEVQLREALATEAQMSATPMKPQDVINGAMGACATREDGSTTCDTGTASAGTDQQTTSTTSSSGNGTITLDEAQIQTLLKSAEWPELKFSVSAIIADHLYSGAPHITLDAPHPHGDTLPSSSDSELVAAIKELIATMIRPELQKDGGDIRYIGFEEDGNRTMSIELLGACKTCKSSKTTLQDLIERTTRHYIPEVLAIDAFVKKRGKMVSLLTGESVPLPSHNNDDDDDEPEVAETAAVGNDKTVAEGTPAKTVTSVL